MPTKIGREPGSRGGAAAALISLELVQRQTDEEV